MKISLERRLEIKKYHIQATISRPIRRDDMVALLKQAEDHAKKRKQLAPEDLISPQGILPNRPLIIAERIIEVAGRLGLIELRGRNVQELTEDGNQALNDSEVFIPEHGTWQVWIAQDELLDHPVIDVKVFKEPSAYFDQKLKHEGKSRHFQDCPEAISDLNEKRVICHAKEKHLRFDEIKTKMEPGKSNDKLKIELLLNPTKPTEFWLVGRLDGEDIRSPIHTPIKLEHADIWQGLLSGVGLGGRWSDEKGCLLRNFDEITTDLAKDTFLDQQTFPRPSLPGLGIFEDTLVTQIPITPADNHEATKWSSWLLLHRIGPYQWPETYQGLTSQIEAQFKDHNVKLPGQGELAEQMRTTMQGHIEIDSDLLQRYWMVQAPLDLDTEVSQ